MSRGLWPPEHTQGSYASGKCQGNFVFKVRECQEILCCVSEKWIFAKMSGKCQGIFVFQFVSNDEKQKIARVVFLTFGYKLIHVYSF